MFAKAEPKRKDPAKSAAASARSAKVELTPISQRLAFQLVVPPTASSSDEQEAQAAADAVVPGQSGKGSPGANGTPSAPPSNGNGNAASAGSAAGETAALGLVVEDGAPLQSGQIHRTQFVELISSEIERVAGEELAEVGRTANDCPYITHWVDFYRGQSALHIERAIQRYARPERSDLATVQTAITTRVRTAVLVWIRTGGREVQAPEGVSWFGTDDRLPDSVGAVQTLAFEGAAHRQPVANDPAAVQARLTAGHSLDGGVRTRMESAFGQSFSGVRLHKDAVASQLASSFSARAFTVGNDIAFAAGHYNPGTLSGDGIIAHELAHTIQQRGARSVADGASKDQSNSGSLERDADHSAAHAMIATWRNDSATATQPLETAMPRMSSSLRLSRCSSCEPDREPTPTPAPTPTPTPTPVPPPPDKRDQMKTFLETTILNDNQVEAAEWERVRTRAGELGVSKWDLNSVLGFGLNFEGPAADVFAEFAMSNNPVTRRLAGKFSSAVSQGQRRLAVDPLPLLLDDILQDSVINREELEALRDFYFALSLDAASISATLQQRHLSANLRSWLAATLQLGGLEFGRMLSKPGLLPLRLQAGAGGELDIGRDLRPELVRTITADGDWYQGDFKLVRTLVGGLSRPDATAFFQQSGIEATSAGLLAVEFTRPDSSYLRWVQERTKLSLHFQQQGAEWALTQGSRTDLALPWHPTIPGGLPTQGGPAVGGRGEEERAIPNFTFSSGATEAASAVTYVFRGHRFEIILAETLYSDAGLFDRLDNALSHIPTRFIPLIRQLVCDPQNHPTASADASRDGRVNLYFRGAGPHIPQGELNQTTAHEFGHLVSFNAAAADPLFWDSWEKAMKADGIAVSRYGMTNELEDFAESFLAFLGRGAGFGATYSHRAAILDGLVNPKPAPRSP